MGEAGGGAGVAGHTTVIRTSAATAAFEGRHGLAWTSGRVAHHEAPSERMAENSNFALAERPEPR